MIVAVSFPTARDTLIDSISYSKFDNTLTNNILHVWDTIDDTTLNSIVSKFGKPKYIVMDSFSYYKTSIDIPVFYVDAWIEQQLKQFESMNVTAVNNVTTKYTANFLINKKQINRFLAIKLCEVFDIDPNYTWSGIDKDFDLAHIVQEKQQLDDSLIDQHWAEILSPISKFKKRWYPSQGQVVSNISVKNHGNNVKLWNQHFNNVVSTSATSLITESVWTQSATTFSEKTMFSVLGLTFPIWVGGMNSAEYWKSKGFDTFDDIIDHSYQNLPTLLQRCFYAFYLNKDILTDQAKASALRAQHLNRLISNRNLLTSATIKAYNQKIIQQWPDDLQMLGNNSIIKHLPGLKSYLDNAV